MKCTIKFLKSIQNDFDWSTNGWANFEKQMVKMAKKAGFVEVDRTQLEETDRGTTYFKKLLKKCVETFDDPNLSVQVGKELREHFKKLGMTCPIIIKHPFHKNQFPDCFLLEGEKFEYLDSKVYGTKDKAGKVYIGEKLEKPNGIYVMFDKHTKRVDFRRGLQFNSNLEHANNVMANLKMHMPVIPPHLNDILSGENGGFGFRIVRNKGKKYIPWKDNNAEFNKMIDNA